MKAPESGEMLEAKLKRSERTKLIVIVIDRAIKVVAQLCWMRAKNDRDSLYLSYCEKDDICPAD